MNLSNTWLRSLLILAAVAAEAAAQQSTAPADRREQLTQLSKRLSAGDLSAIDELLAFTHASSAGHAPTNAELERLRLEVERLRTARPAPIAPSGAKTAALTTGAPPQGPRDPESAVREARAWLRAGDPNHCLKVLPPIDQDAGSHAAAGSSANAGSSPSTELESEVFYVKASALERLGRDEEALDAYRRAAAATTSPLLKLGATSGIDHLEWRMRRAGAPVSSPGANNPGANNPANNNPGANNSAARGPEEKP